MFDSMQSTHTGDAVCVWYIFLLSFFNDMNKSNGFLKSSVYRANKIELTPLGSYARDYGTCETINP
jgi:hypothetical protein